MKGCFFEKEAAMGWKKVTVMSQRIEFVTLALQESICFSELCRRFGISRKTGYKFLNRYMEEGLHGLYDRSRRPRNSPNATDSNMEQLILDLRDKHPAWGGRKLKRRLEHMGQREIPSPSTITVILRRKGRISQEESKKHKAWQRFEAERHEYSSFTVWLIRLGIQVVHSRPYHPQTLGKDERFHRTMNAEVVMGCIDKPIGECQRLFDRWGGGYNTERPHESLDMKVPAKCYQVSEREFPESLPEIEYSPLDEVRKVQDGGIVHYKNREFRVSSAFKGQRVAIRPTNEDGRFDVYFCGQRIAQINLV